MKINDCPLVRIFILINGPWCIIIEFPSLCAPPRRFSRKPVQAPMSFRPVSPRRRGRTQRSRRFLDNASPGLGAAFLDDLEHAITVITAHPEASPSSGAGAAQGAAEISLLHPLFVGR